MERVMKRGEAVAVLSMHASPLGSLGHAQNGGMNLAVRLHCEGLAARGVPTDVFTRRERSEDPAEELIAPGSRLVRLTAGPMQPLDVAASFELVPAFIEALLEHQRSERRQYRLLHSHYWLSGMVGERAVAAWGVPWVHSSHTLARTKLAAGLPVHPARSAIEQHLFQVVDRVVAGSGAEAADLRELYGCPPDRICVVNPGVDLAAFAPRDTSALRQALGLEGRRVVISAGRLEPLKGGDLLVQAMARMALDPGLEDVMVLVVGDNSGEGHGGGPGGERARLERLARDLGVEDRLRFLGSVPQPELAAYLSLADVCAVPSHTESFGLVALEAQACGTPVVAANVGGLTEVVEDGVTGYLVPRTAEAFADRLAAVLGQPSLRTALGDRARLRAARFSWNTSARRLQQVYERVLDPHTQASPCGFVAA